MPESGKADILCKSLHKNRCGGIPQTKEEM